MNAHVSVEKKDDPGRGHPARRRPKDDEELVGSNPEQRNWRGILIAILVILIVLALIIVAIILVSPKTDVTDKGEPFTFNDVFSSEFKPRHFSAQWIGKKNIYVYRSREGEVMEYNADLNKTQVIMDNSTFRELNTDDYFVSEDLRYVLIAYDSERIHRHSYLARYAIYNRYAQNPNQKLIPFPQGVSEDWSNRRLQYAGWSESGSSLTFVYNNNLYYQTDPFTTLSEITSTGGDNIYNGIADWLYEEEILHGFVAHWWSPDSAYISYAQFDDTDVPVYEFPYYGEGTDIYGGMQAISYPKAGDKGSNINPKVKVFVVDTANPRASHKVLSPPNDLADQEHYVMSVVWQDDNHVMVTWSNRAQNKSIVTLCDAKSADCHDNLVEMSKEGKGWVQFPTPRFIEGGQTYLTILPERDGSHGYFKHIAMVTAPHDGERGRKSFVTQGTWDVMAMSGFDEEHKQVYFIGTNNDPRHRHLMHVGIADGDATILTPQCVTCGVDKECQYVSTSFSHSGRYYLLECQGPGVPSYTLRSTRDNRAIVVEDNADIRARLEKKALPMIMYEEIEVADGHKIWAKVLLPPSLNRDHITQYPVLVYTYAGPGTQRVTEHFSLGWETYLVSTEQVIYVMVDGRGSSGRGDRWMHAIYRHLGTLEVEDQISAAKHLRETFPYVDKKRIAIWGWSYGGFVTAHAMGDGSDVFPCGIAVAPVTDFRYYDTAYTERYMGLAHSNDNYRGYDNANVSRKAEHFQGKHIMIVHGTADDNVHFQHTAQFLKALTQADVDFRVQVYTDKNHALHGPKTSLHLYKTMTSYLKHECWEGGEPKEPVVAEKEPRTEKQQ